MKDLFGSNLNPLVLNFKTSLVEKIGLLVLNRRKLEDSSSLRH